MHTVRLKAKLDVYFVLAVLLVLGGVEAEVPFDIFGGLLLLGEMEMHGLELFGLVSVRLLRMK